MDELSEEERAIVGLVRDFVDRDVRPVASELEHANAYPERLIEQMKQLCIFGLAIPEPWGAARVSTPCYALVTEETARGSRSRGTCPSWATRGWRAASCPSTTSGCRRTRCSATGRARASAR